MRIHGDENNEFLMEELRKRLKEYRVDSNITQVQMAEKAGISPATVERMERGENVRVSQVLSVLRVLGLNSSLELLVPEREVSALDLYLDRKPRRRASKVRNSREERTWKWGDEH